MPKSPMPKRTILRSLVHLTAALTVLAVLPTSAFAISAGITGNSGKQGANCADCHNSGGVAPLVRLEGPTAVYAGALATFRFVVQSQSARQQVGGFNVAASQGQLDSLRGEGAHVEFGELTHDSPKPASENETTWLFTWRAPQTTGSETLFGAGLSANGTGTRNGDGMALLALAVAIVDDPRPGDANCDGNLSAADLTAIAVLTTSGMIDDCVLADADCDGTVDQTDITVLIAVLFDSPTATECELVAGNR